jgi:HAD domain in Swiss Army Knife RNA repair proteins
LVLGTAANGSGALHNGVAGTEESLSNLTLVPGGARDPRPVLAVDVDGVISLFGFDEPLTEVPGEVHLIDGMAHCISREAGERLARLADHYELVWATGWEERANDYLPELLGLPDELPYLTFGGNARFGTAHWKVDAIAEYAGDRPVAWVDDSIDDSCKLWALSREAPTLLVEVDSRRGLEEAHVEALIKWVEDGFQPR